MQPQPRAAAATLGRRCYTPSSAFGHCSVQCRCSTRHPCSMRHCCGHAPSSGPVATGSYSACRRGAGSRHRGAPRPPAAATNARHRCGHRRSVHHHRATVAKGCFCTTVEPRSHATITLRPRAPPGMLSRPTMRAATHCCCSHVEPPPPRPRARPAPPVRACASFCAACARAAAVCAAPLPHSRPRRHHASRERLRAPSTAVHHAAAAVPRRSRIRSILSPGAR